jgi:outer membrane receptor protein involved in Fe transport
MAKTIRWIGLALILLTSSIYLFGQATASSSIRGTVTDPSGAVLVGAQVTVTNTNTGTTRTVTTGSDGGYMVEPLQVGVYSVKVSMQGFSSATAAKVETLVGGTSTQNFSLKTGTETQTVEVTSEAPLLDALKTDVSENITPTQVQELPMIGRDVANLAYLAPGVKAADSYDPTKNRMAILSVNGQGGRNVNVTVNGVDNKDNTVGGPVMQLPLEGVEEFAISTQRFSAANGRSEGAAINMITKGGTNQYHGSFFAFFRDQALQQDQTLADGSKSHPPYSRQQFGGSIGGAIKKDKVFTFFAYERQREHQSISEDPNAFSELSLAQSIPYQGGAISAQPAAVIPTPFFENRYSGRLDYKINDSNTIYGTYNFQANNSLNDQSDGTFDLQAGNFTVNHMALGNLTWNSVLSHTLVNQFTFGYQYWNNLIASGIVVPDVTFPSAAFGTNTNVPQQSYQKKWQFKDDLIKTVGNHSFKTGVDYIYTPSLGGFFEYNTPIEYDFAADPSCILATTSTATCGPAVYPQGFATPGALAGISASIGDPRTDVPGGVKQLGLYFQDDWKVSRRLTLNLGVRWDKDYNMVGGSAVLNSRTYQELVAAAPFDPTIAAFVKSQPHDDNKDFSPRVGFAYDLTGSGKFLVRGGYGLYYGDVFQNIPIFMEQQHNATVFQTVLSITDAGQNVPGTGKTLGQYQFGVDPVPTFAAASSLVDGSVGRVIDPNYRNPVSEEFNIGTSYQLNNNSVVEIEYTHVLSLHENKTINIDQQVCTPTGNTAPWSSSNPPVTCAAPFSAALAAAGQPDLASVRNEESIGRSHYDGVNLSYRQQMTHHFSVNANYTLAYANGFDSGGGSFRNYPRLATAPFAPYEWGPTPNDERHHITFSGIFDLSHGIQFAPIIQFGTARPYNVTNSKNYLATGGGTANAVVVPISDPTDYLAFKGDAYGAQNCYYVTQQCTISKYDPLRGDKFFELDTRLTKDFKFGERMHLQLIAQAFNLTNRANYGNNFTTNINSGNFGKAVGFIAPTATNIPRSMTGEFGVHFSF